MKVVVAMMMMSLSMHAETTVTKAAFGQTPEGQSVEVITLANETLVARVITYGAKLISAKAPDRAGRMEDVVLGYDTLLEWLADTKTHFGAVVGRYGNRLAQGAFAIDGHLYQVPMNSKRNALHGGTVGFDKRFWSARLITHGVELTLVSADGDMGFPGTLTAKVSYTLLNNELSIHYEATTDKPTVVNLTNHSYFNLSGDDRTNILGHQLTLHAQFFTPVDTTLIPTGEIRAVAGTPMDFRTSHAIGERIGDEDEQLKIAGGYDLNWVVDGTSGALREAALVREPVSGRTLRVMTTEPGIQFYSGNFLDGSFTGRHGRSYTKNMGLCLETQHFPDSPNHANFPSTVLRPGQARGSTTVFIFGVTP